MCLSFLFLFVFLDFERQFQRVFLLRRNIFHQPETAFGVGELTAYANLLITVAKTYLGREMIQIIILTDNDEPNTKVAQICCNFSEQNLHTWVCLTSTTTKRVYRQNIFVSRKNREHL